jgi:hypothetical protein
MVGIAPIVDGGPLPDDEDVFRLCDKLSHDGKPCTSAFELDSTEKNEDPLQRHSVWARSRTLPHQARELSGKTYLPWYLLILTVKHVRSIRYPLCSDATMMNVVWHFLGVHTPGADGHAGITGLGEKSVSRAIRKHYRLELCDITRVDGPYNDI